MTLRDDAIAMLTDFGVCVTYRDCVTVGVFDQTRVNESDASGMVRQVHRRILKIVTGTLGTLVKDTPITIDGRAYRIRDRASDQGEVDELHEFWEINGA